VLNKTPPNVSGSIVIAMQLFPTFQTLKLVTVAVVLVSESTLAVTALLRGIGG